MSTFLQTEFGVAMSGVDWDIGNFKLYQSTDPSVILFITKQPHIAKNDKGRYQVAVSTYRQQVEGTYKITGGSAVFTITSALQLDAQQLAEQQEIWRAQMKGMGRPMPDNPRFIALNTQKGRAEVLINEVSGVPHQAHNDKDIGTPGGTNSFMIKLTELGAQEWAQGIRDRTAIPAGVKMKYEYLRMLPTCGARVLVHGQRVFEHISAALDVSVQGFPYGGSAKIEAAWDKLVASGAIEIIFAGQLSPDAEKIRTELVTTFANQAREQLFNRIFAPLPQVDPAQAGKTSGTFGGANFALKYKKASEVMDESLDLKFEGWTWLEASMDADCSALFSDLDPSYLTEVNTQMSVPASIVVDGDPMLKNVALSWSASEGKGPEAPVFGTDGGNTQYIVTSQKPNDVLVNCLAKISFTPPKWPIIQQKLSQKIADGGNQMVFKPSSLVGRHYIYMFVRDADHVLGISELTDDDYLVANVTYGGPHLPAPVKDSAKITPFEPLEFSYPLDPDGRLGKATFAAFGVIGGKMVNAPAVEIDIGESAVFILANRAKGTIQLVSSHAMMQEGERDDLASRLLAARARPVKDGKPTGGKITSEGLKDRPGGDGGDGLRGELAAVEYGPGGAELFIRTNGATRRIPLRSLDLAARLDDSRKMVSVTLDESGYASTVRVELA
ncbi:MAG: hypothetical protein QM820_36365 [Minicystis sp.]